MGFQIEREQCRSPWTIAFVEASRAFGALVDEKVALRDVFQVRLEVCVQRSLAWREESPVCFRNDLSGEQHRQAADLDSLQVSSHLRFVQPGLHRLPVDPRRTGRADEDKIKRTALP